MAVTFYEKTFHWPLGCVTMGGKRDVPLEDDIKRGHPGMYLLGVVVTILSIAGFIAPCITSFRGAATIQMIALGVLTAVTYGILNDLVACRKCIEYFTIGHTPFHKRLLKTDNPTANALVWGIHATWFLGLIAGGVLAIAATAVNKSVINPLHLSIFMLGGSVLSFGVSHLVSHQVQKRAERDPKLDSYFDDRYIPPVDDFYHPVNLESIPQNKRSAYKGVGARNATGYFMMPLIGVIALILIIVARIQGMNGNLRFFLK